MDVTREDIRAMDDDLDTLWNILALLDDAHDQAKRAQLRAWATKLDALRAEVKAERERLADDQGEMAKGYAYLTGKYRW